MHFNKIAYCSALSTLFTKHNGGISQSKSEVTWLRNCMNCCQLKGTYVARQLVYHTEVLSVIGRVG